MKKGFVTTKDTEVLSLSSPSSGLQRDKSVSLEFESMINLSRQNSDLSFMSMSSKDKRKTVLLQDSNDFDNNPITDLPSLDTFDNVGDSPRILRRTSHDNMSILEFAFQPYSDKKFEPGIQASLSTDILDSFKDNPCFDINNIFRNDSMDDGNFGQITVGADSDDNNLSETEYFRSDTTDHEREKKKQKTDKITKHKAANDTDSKSPKSLKPNPRQITLVHNTDLYAHPEDKDTESMGNDNAQAQLSYASDSAYNNTYSLHADKTAYNNRGKYRCGRCGKLKNNHECEYEEALTCDKGIQTLATKILINEKGNNLEITDRIMIINTQRVSIQDETFSTNIHRQYGFGIDTSTATRPSIADTLPNIIMPATSASATFTRKIGNLAPGCYFARDSSGQYYHVDDEGVSTKLITIDENRFLGLDGKTYVNATGGAVAPNKAK